MELDVNIVAGGCRPRALLSNYALVLLFFRLPTVVPPGQETYGRGVVFERLHVKAQVSVQTKSKQSAVTKVGVTTSCMKRDKSPNVYL